MTLVVDINAVCLICLEIEEHMQCVNERDEQTPNLTIAQKIGRCSGLSLNTNNKKLPNKICLNCLNDLNAAWNFHQKWESACQLFRSIEENDSKTAYIEFSKMKLPPNIVIKKIKPDEKTINFPVEIKQTNIKHEKADMDQYNSIDRVKANNQINRVRAEQLDSIVETEEDTEGMRISYDDYYEAEEVYAGDELDEDTLDDVTEISFQQANSTIAIEHNIKKENNDIDYAAIGMNVTIKKEYEVDQLEANLLPTYMKRTRGRPKKNENALVTDTPITKTVQIKTETDNDKNTVIQKNMPQTIMNIKTVQQVNAKNNINEKFEIKHVPTRKRKANTVVRPPKICEICGNSYKYQHALLAHMRRHNNDRPFVCEFCSKGFVSAVELRRHMRVHTGHKPYACEFCGRRYSDFGSRIKHERTHTGERPYKCNSCNKTFAYAHVLSVHLRTHTGEKKFKCHICEKGFTKKTYLESHIQQHERSTRLLKQQAMQNLGSIIIKDEDFQECIFTEYIDDVEEMNEDQIITEVDRNEENLDEEHLDDTSEYVIGSR